MDALVSTTWYYYNCSGNVTRVVTQQAGSQQHTATRMVYAKNEKTVSFVLGESWNWNGLDPCPTAYALSYAREFRYDSGRARYLNRTLDIDALLLDPSVYTPTSSTWSDYDGDNTYGDFTVSGTTVTTGNLYEPGLWNKESGVSQFLHNDHLGTLRNTSSSIGASGTPRVFTAFGERIAGPSGADRYGYAGEHGYQTDPSGAFPFLHLGARFYDPSSGRFLQRDPAGTQGGLNVYVYCQNNPLVRIDPRGLWFWEVVSGIASGALAGGLAGLITGGPAGALAGAVAGGVAGGASVAISEIASGGNVTVGGAIISGGLAGIPGGSVAGLIRGGASGGIIAGVGAATGGVTGGIGGGISGGWPGAVAGAAGGAASGAIGGAGSWSEQGWAFDVAFGCAYGAVNGLFNGL